MASPHPNVTSEKDVDFVSNPWSTLNLNLSLPSGETVFYREAGNPDHPTVLLLHGFPSSSHQYRNLIPLLAGHGYHVLAPDLAGFGFTTVPAGYTYTFANLAMTVSTWLRTLRKPPNKYALYIFDYGAPVGLRLALQNPSAISAIVSQSGNAYAAGLLPGTDPLQAYWKSGSRADRDALAGFVTFDGTKSQYVGGTRDLTRLAPETYTLDAALLARPGMRDIQLDLLYDYRTNVALYPDFQKWFRQSQVPLLAVWGKDDPFFGHPELFKQELPKAEIHTIDAGHFAIESNLADIAGYMVPFLNKNVKH